MFARRYTVLIADRTTGVVRRVTISVRVAAGLVVGVLLAARAHRPGRQVERPRGDRPAPHDEERARSRERQLPGDTGELTTQIQSLENVIDDLGSAPRSIPPQARAMQRLPAVVKARAAGGASAAERRDLERAVRPRSSRPEDTFGVLRTLLQGLESRLRYVRRDVERQEALAAATPSIWPTFGWLTGTFGGRADPFTGERGFHQGLDISTDKGQPVYATADGTVESAASSGDYGNLVVLQHDFGLSTRYGHLSKFARQAGHRVKRGDVIGYVGSTGRSTGTHLHYEILANGKLINPLQLLTQAHRSGRTASAPRRRCIAARSRRPAAIACAS